MVPTKRSCCSLKQCIKTVYQSRALELAGEIVKLLVCTALERGKTSLVFMLPGARESLYNQSRGEWI
jgi:hypothetical protein